MVCAKKAKWCPMLKMIMKIAAYMLLFSLIYRISDSFGIDEVYVMPWLMFILFSTFQPGSRQPKRVNEDKAVRRSRLKRRLKRILILFVTIVVIILIIYYVDTHTQAFQ